MARLEIPSIVVHKGCSRSPSRSSSPTGVISSVMPALPSSKHAIISVSGGNNSVTYTVQSDQEMLDGNVNVNVDNSTTDYDKHPPSNSPDKIQLEANNCRNRTNTKVKLLVRSHAMRESTSPPREALNGSTSLRSPSDHSDKPKYPPSLSPPTPQLNNNESIYNSNLTTHSPKQTRTIATSPTCRTPPRNSQSPKSPTSPPHRDKDPTHRSKATSPHIPTKCNNCVKNNQNDRPGLLQTPASPSKSAHQTPKLNHQSSRNDHQTSRNDSQNSRRPNTLSVCNNQCPNQCSNTLSIRSSSRHKFRHPSAQNSGSLDSNISPCLSRDNSTELYTDSTGIDLEQFIAVTINRNQKDRSVLLKIEKELIEFAKDRQKVCHKFPNMSSYNRMLVHRVAAYFGMEHNVDQSGLSVIVTRTKNMRIPDTRFKEHIRDDLLLTEEPRRSILKRDSSSFEDGFNFKSPDRMSGDYCRRSKSFEEREEEYEKVRRRIFKDGSGDSEVTSWPYWSSTESSDVSARYRLLHPGDHSSMRTRLSKGESCDGRENFRGVLRPSVSKSFSFGGYTRGMLARGDSVSSTRSAGPRLTKQDSGTSVCSRLSPSSSGYKSQSQRSDATISPSPSPSPIPTIPCNHRDASQNSTSIDGSQGNQTVMWAVSSISSVPAGSIIMNPRTNQPYANSDGSIYRFDPENPPKIFSDIAESRESPAEGSAPESPRISSKNLKRKNSPKDYDRGVTNTATSPTLPFTASPPPIIQECPHVGVKTTEAQGCVHPAQSYGNFSQQNSAEISYNQSPVYSQGQGIVLRQPEMNQGPAPIPPPADIVFGQNNVYGNYSPMMHQACHPQTSEVSELSGYFMGMNVYEGPRSGGEAQATHTHGFSAPPPQVNAHAPQNGHGYWQPPPPAPPPPVPPPVPPPQQQQHQHQHQQHQHHGQPANGLPPQQTMYFVPPSGAAVTVPQAPNDRQQMHQHQRFTSGYAYNPQTMTPPNQTAPNYVNGYPISYNSMQTVAPNPPDYSYQSPLHMIPTYYPPGQPAIQPPPVMWRVPTPPNTPTSNQMPGVPVMYVNSGTYGPPTMLAGSFGHQLQNAGTPGPTGGYMTPPILPNLMFRQNMPMVTTGIRASTPSGSQRTSRSPTPAHEFFNNNNVNCGGNGNGNGGAVNGDNRNAQSQSRYPLPMYQGLHFVQGDIRLMHPGNSRLQYAPVPSPPVVQGCPRPFRPPSYSSNTSGCPTPNSFDGRGQKLRKPRSKITTLPPTGVRPNVYQVPSMPSLSSNPPTDMREGTVKVTITRRNPVTHY